ncbi:hypothetical protein V496_10247 [Pseudogymnoascus sp. VKM F-4515 (FW-2607)]|nr:hypothetical protein V496_10247 [Pseudogymnoascus sp. VKM F-4515 (FW-2607)]KFY94716.1 hypothetical protein V498_03752 [Pseudogymnoascus sp. VKM F-4517 (FW-2822)]
MALSHHAVVTPRLRGDGIATDAGRANQELAGVHWRERDSHGGGDGDVDVDGDEEAEGMEGKGRRVHHRL